MLHVRSPKTGALAASAVVCGALLFTLFGMAYAKRKHPAVMPDLMAIASVEAQTATVNKPAPDISWREQKSGKVHHLSEFRGKPVILCFGSYTCGPFRTALNLIDQTYRQNTAQMHCLLVYTKEAHPELGSEDYVRNPRTWQDRAAAACDLRKDVKLTMPIVVDTQDNRATTAFEARPSRIYALDRQGKIVFASTEFPGSDMALGAVNAVQKMLVSKPANAAE